MKQLYDVYTLLIYPHCKSEVSLGRQISMVFSSYEEAQERVDWQFLQNGSVNLFWREEIFDAAIDALEELGYKAIKLNFQSVEKFTFDISDALKWEEHFGYYPWNGVMAALEEGFEEEPFSSANDAVFCLSGFHKMMEQDPYLAKYFLNILEDTSRIYLLFGKRFISLIQTNDPNFHSEPLRRRSAHWNTLEWENVSRR